MKINVMRKNERFIGMFGNKIALENQKGEIRIVVLEDSEEGIRVGREEIIIGFGNGTVEIGDSETGIEVTTF